MTVTEEQKTEEPKMEPRVVSREAEEVQTLWAEYGRPIVIGVVLGLAIVFGFYGYRGYESSQNRRAAQLLARAGSIEDLRSVASQFKDTASGPLAMLALAAQYFDSEQYLLAQQTYRQFEETYPKHVMVKSARICKAYCLEASGQLDAAVTEFSSFTEQDPEHFLAPVAHLGKGRCLVQLGRFDEARIVYEDFIANYPESAWIDRIDAELLYLEKAERAAKAGGGTLMPAPSQPLSPFLVQPTP